jgi:hypothetical protein
MEMARSKRPHGRLPVFAGTDETTSYTTTGERDMVFVGSNYWIYYDKGIDAPIFNALIAKWLDDMCPAELDGMNLLSGFVNR